MLQSSFAKGILIVGLLILAIGCEANNTAEQVPDQERIQKALRNSYELPPKATNIVQLGNNWATFELEGKKFMVRSRYLGKAGYQYTIVQLVEDKKCD